MAPRLPITLADRAKQPLDRLLVVNSGEFHWQEVPLATKQNYFNRWSLSQRCLGGAVGAADIVHCSSGNSEQRTLWACDAFDELAECGRFEQEFWDKFEAHQHPTLAVVAFPMVGWMGGMIATLCLRYLTLKGYKLTTVTPSNSVPDILALAQSLASHHSQIVLLGCPPFLKGVVDAALQTWQRACHGGSTACSWFLAGEVFSEEWCSLMAQRLGIQDISRDVVNLYGTSDAGVIGNETALSSTLRRWLAQHPNAARELFGVDWIPTLLQYDPYCRLLEMHPEDGSLVATATGMPRTVAPLLMYCIGDAGGLISHEDMLAFARERGLVLPDGLASRNLPFAFVFGRSFWTVSVFGANVYVENLMSGLEQRELADITTGKFVLFVEESTDLDKQLAMRLELAPGVDVSKELVARVQRVLLRELLQVNSEYAAHVPPEKQLPWVHLHLHADPPGSHLE